MICMEGPNMDDAGNGQALLSCAAFIKRPPFPMNKEPRREPLTWRQLLKILAAVALLELGFFLFRLGAAWWNAT